MLPKDLRFVIEGGPFSQGLSQPALLQHWLRRSTIPFCPSLAKDSLRDAIIVGLDVEWWEYDKGFITELGVSIIDPRFVTDWTSPWKVLETMVTQHVRIKSNAHMVNRDLCKGHPDKFEFGKTSFVNVEQAKEMLRCSFLRFDTHGCPRPVIFVGHAVDNDASIIKKEFGLNLEALDILVATIDTQVLAAEIGLVQGTRTPKLSDLLAKYKISEPYLHNGGNDIACTIIAAVFMCSPFAPNNNVQAYYDRLKQHLHTTGKVMHGSETYCIKCDFDKHLTADCQLYVYCMHCAGSKETINMAPHHKTEKCLIATIKSPEPASKKFDQWSAPARFPVPCSMCIVSTDPQRYNLDHAYGHLEEDCKFKAGGSESVVNTKWV
ncbi:hypothetical protein CC86DRAFT_407700 [Ophiobolus disseminans]|uniref:Gfd2/YDR514C-like C-terminal domain-containing protein n=1 Tax=Ophiobolus disseminans TaxID=1469910 RepID=A0A6A6ZWQ7_9PLEO|nr:hypothetical protein CC86DRAFT_407700 [Ophiobolus disseminans]